jgi:hypothetical protein
MTHHSTPGRSKDWKLGYQAGARHAKERIWAAVYDYVHRHDPKKADRLRADIVAALMEKSDREREAEQLDPAPPDQAKETA